MSNPVSVDNLALGVRALSRSGVPDMGKAIEEYLERELQGLPFAEKLSLLENLACKFPPHGAETARHLSLEPAEAARLMTLFLGDGIAASELSSPEISEKLAQSLNTVFDSLNRIICVIQSTLLGHRPEIETIRHVIGSQIGGKGGETSLKTYLDQIQQAFLTSHEAFKEAARSVVVDLLSALDPDTLANERNSGLRFGPLRKAELFEFYQEKFRECRKWVDSGRFSEILLREFEKYCQKNYREHI